MIKELIKRYFTVKVTKAVPTPVMKNNLLKGKVALIIGGSGEIGFSIAKAFVESGCKVIICGTNAGKLKECLQSDNSSFMKSVMLNVRDVNSIASAISEAHNAFGQIDILVYSAGVHGSDAFGAVKESTWDNVMDINLKGMYFSCQFFADYLINNNHKGHILTIGSASSGKPGWTPYEISKCGVKSLTLGFADKLIGKGIVVNSIAPGPVATPMLNMSNDNITWPGNPSGRMCTPEEIANYAVFLVSELGDMVVGDTFYVSGGSGTICIDK